MMRISKRLDHRKHRIFRQLCTAVFSSIILIVALSDLTEGAGQLETSKSILALVGGRLIAGTESPPVENATVIIQTGKILYAGPSSNIEIPSQARVININRKTVLPGFINTHISGTPSEHDLKLWARSGVTSIRLLGCDPKWYGDFKNKFPDKPSYTRLIADGPILTKRDGYPRVPFGKKIPSVFIHSREQAKKKCGNS